MRTAATVVRTASIVIFVGGLASLPFIVFNMGFCNLDNPTYETIWVVDVLSFPFLGGAALFVARSLYRRGNYAGAITCNMIPWVNVMVFLIIYFGIVRAQGCYGP